MSKFTSISLLIAATAVLVSACDHTDPNPPPRSATVASSVRSPQAPVSAAPRAAVASASASAASSAVAVAVPTAAERQPMNVILVTIDSLRNDMPWNGYGRDIAPNLTKIFKNAVTYKHHYSVSSFTSKSVPGILSGHYPSELERTSPFFTRYSESNEFMAEVLKKAGVRTMSGQAHMYLDRPSGLTQGFDIWQIVDGITFDYNKDPYVTSQKMTPMAIDMLSKPENTSGRFFAYYHYMDPHDVYKEHVESPKFGKKARDVYDQEIFYTDLWLKKLFDFVATQPWASKTAIIISSDHGEAFGEHKIYRHAFELYDVLVNVPLMFVVPGAPAREVPAFRSQIDLVPTIYDLMGQPIPEGLAGKSLVPEIFGQNMPDRPVICDLPADTFNERRRSLIEGGYKLIAFGDDLRWEMYNLLEDPGETKNLYRKDSEKTKAMLARYKEVSKSIKYVKATGKAVKK